MVKSRYCLNNEDEITITLEGDVFKRGKRIGVVHGDGGIYQYKPKPRGKIGKITCDGRVYSEDSRDYLNNFTKNNYTAKEISSVENPFVRSALEYIVKNYSFKKK